MLTTFIGVARESWAVWGTWASVGATLLLGGGALWVAWRQLGHLRNEAKAASEASKNQLDAIQLQVSTSANAAAKQLAEMETSRLDAQRPFVRLARAVRHAESVTLTFENIGPGPAIAIFVKAWFMGVEEEIQDNQALRRAHVRLQQIVESGQEQTADFNIGGIAAGGRTKMPVGKVALDPRAKAEAVGVFIEFEDVFGRRFPVNGDIGLQLGGVEDKTMTVTFA